MVLALRLSCSRGLIQASEVEEFIQLLRSMNLPIEAPKDMTPQVFLDLMARDKKVVNGRLRLVLISAIGQACIVDDATESELIDLLS